MSTSRMTGVSKNAITKLLAQAGDACSCYLHEHMVNLPCDELQLDELWSFIKCKERNKDTSVRTHTGDAWIWTALCPRTKLIPSWRIGDRSNTTAYAFCADLASRFKGRVQITTDGLAAYRWAVSANFSNVDMAQMVKVYGKNSRGQDVCTEIQKTVVLGNPDMKKASTSLVERSNLTMRMTNRRLSRLTNGFSKNIENHCHMFALSMMVYNYSRKHMSIKSTPAQAAGLSDHTWTFEDILSMMESHHERRACQAFEKEFSRLKFEPVRSKPKTFQPETPKTPWYLDPESGGPDPEIRKPGVAYRTDLS